MGEFHGQILGMIIVIAIFGAITPLMIDLFTDLAEDVIYEVNSFEDTLNEELGRENKINLNGKTYQLLSYSN